MATDITIIDAQGSDIPALITIYIDALEPDVLTTFLTSHRRVEAIAKQTVALQNSLGKRFTAPTNRCHIHKALDTQTSEIVGWSLVRWEDGKIAVPEKAEGEEFSNLYVREVLKTWLDVCGGKPHIVLGGLYVAPKHQGKGVGTKLVENIYSRYDLQKEAVIVQTRAMSESFYEKLGWKTLASVDIDLSTWGGKGRGYGVHRSPQMLRDPNNVLEQRRKVLG